MTESTEDVRQLECVEDPFDTAIVFFATTVNAQQQLIDGDDGKELCLVVLAAAMPDTVV